MEHEQCGIPTNNIYEQKKTSSKHVLKGMRPAVSGHEYDRVTQRRREFAHRGTLTYKASLRRSLLLSAEEIISKKCKFK
jgi:hypothetical protein